MNERSKLVALAALAVVVILSVSLFIARGQDWGTPRNPQQQVQQIAKRGFSTDNSFFTSEENELVLADIKRRQEEFTSGSNATVENLVDMARKVRDLRDYDQALALFAVADTMNPADLFYKLDIGRIYLERQQWEAARQVFEPMKVTWPVHEAFLGLAEAYKHIEGTPNYVIDQIYEESVYRNNGEFSVLEEYAEWLEKTDRAEKAVPYYEEMYRLVPQPTLEQKIAELKAAYKK